MYFINPFKGLRPTKENAASVTIASTDHMSKDIVKNHKKNNPWSYLNIFESDNDSKSKEKFELMNHLNQFFSCLYHQIMNLCRFQEFL